ncbi:RNA 2',3'-cyclic phosphodiesterase [Alkalicoccus chagannorensis]|uniref:RNA 2',3'-cyclic phosphodiesterase n=1 Tax=Alkalicoccus chagannorensis TaxID=427072 RepID=UPI00040F9B64|nr:RNA 2',3'-cyclic phosphodiesterase [Alkalicoccus chagannorensis]
MTHHFLGIRVTEQLQKKGRALQESMALDRYYKQLTYEQDMHLTILFLGGWDMDKKRLLWDRLCRLELPGSELSVNGWNGFGSPDYPRVLYMEPQGDLKPLYQVVLKEAEFLGFPSPGRPFRPHVTIAKKKKAAAFPYPSSGTFSGGGINMRASALEWMEVHPGKQPSYTTVEEPLKLGRE